MKNIESVEKKKSIWNRDVTWLVYLIIIITAVLMVIHCVNPLAILKVCAMLGSDAANVQLGRHYNNENKYLKAAKYFLKAAENDEPIAQFYMGLYYSEGKGVAKNLAEAARWYRLAAEQGNAAAQCNLGVCYARGDGVAKDKSEAVRWYSKAAEQGDETAQCNLGMCYEYGRGVNRDIEQAKYWYELSADQGYEKAEEALDRLNNQENKPPSGWFNW